VCGLPPLPGRREQLKETAMSHHADSPASKGALSCPVELSRDVPRVTLAHGDGGRLTRQLVREHIAGRLRNDYLLPLGDAAQLPQPEGPIAVTTDSFVVTPLFFPGGDIGSLAVYGTVNDLAVAGALPSWLTFSLILEEGLPLAVLDRVIASVADAAARCGVAIVAGDTKVVPRGAADGLFINTTGVGVLQSPIPAGPAALAPGDELLISGPAGRHGLAVMAARERFSFEPPPHTDAQPLLEPIRALRQRLGSRIKAMRDATRGGVAAVLHEWAHDARRTLTVEESSFPQTPELQGVSELLGIDPLYFAGEGVFLLAVERGCSDAALAVLRRHPESLLAARIGEVQVKQRFPVTIRRGLNQLQPLDEPTAALLPRIC